MWGRTSKGAKAQWVMSDPLQPAGLKSLDDPAFKARVVRLLVVLSPFAFAGCFVFAALQTGRARDALVIGVAALAICLGAAGTIQLLGAKAKYVAMAIVAIAALIGRR